MFVLTAILVMLGFKFFRYLKQSKEIDPGKDVLIIKLHKLQNAVGKGDIKKTKEIIYWFHQKLARNKQILTDLLTSDVECTTQTDLILAACHNRNADMLDFILNKTDILVHLTDESFDDTDTENKQRTEAFRQALRSNNFKMVEMLYNYWCGDLHWKQQHMKNVEMIGKVLKDAHDVLGPNIDIKLKQNFLFLIKLNAFHREVCTELAKLKPSNIIPKERAAMILRVLRVYNRYSHCKLVSDESKSVKTVYKSSLFHRNLVLSVAYEGYFRSLDFNISSIILVNLNILRKHLKHRFNKTEKYFKDNPNLKIFYKRATESYKEFESETFHFIYRTCEHWRLYSFGKKELAVNFMKEGKKYLIDLNKLESALFRYLERKNFKRNLKKFAKILRVHVIRRDPAEIGIGTQSQSQNSNKTKVVPLLDENYLQTIKYMRDHYSLIKIVGYIQAINHANDVNVLMIERVLHVIGEMLKSTDDSSHLSQSTLALLRIAISVETIRNLHNIRDFLSKANKRQLSTRIYIENTQAQTLFDKIKEELIRIKQIIISVYGIHKCILDKSFLEKGYHLLERHMKSLPKEAQQHIKELRHLVVTKVRINSKEYHQFYREVWKPTGLSVNLLKDIYYMEQKKDRIFSNIQKCKEVLNFRAAIILPSFIQNVKRMLELIIKNNSKVNTINQQLYKYDKSAKMCDCPDGNEINQTQNIAARLMRRNKKVQIDLELLNEVKNYKHHWNSIKDMLHFCLVECDLFAPISHLNLNEDSLPDIPKLNSILADMEAICVVHRSPHMVNLNWWQKIYRLFSNWVNWKGLRSSHFDGIEKLIGEFTAAKEIKEDNPRLEREELISCLIKRLDLLKHTLLYPQRISLKRHVQRFKRDVKFRVILEMIMADIANVLAACSIRLMKKSSRILSEIDLGNVLDHGNPFLDVIGNAFHSHDFANELLDKAMMFAEDGESINALYKLFKGDVGYDTIKAGDQLKMDATQQQLYEKFKKSPNWESYAKLTRLPNRKQT